MRAPVGLGPVFAYEWLIGCRRWQVYALRSLSVAVVLLALAVVWASPVGRDSGRSIKAAARVGQAFFQAIAGTQLALVLLAAPAMTAGAVCLDKSRGTLAQLLVTDLSDAEIVLGKLAARLVPILGLILGILPVTALGTLLGGIDPVELTGAVVVTTGAAVLACSLGMTLSVWGRKTHEVLLVTYALLGGWLILPGAWGLIIVVFGSPMPIPGWLPKTHPFWLAFGNSIRPGAIRLLDRVVFLGFALAISVALIVLATTRIRSVAVRQAGGAPARALGPDRHRYRRRWSWPDIGPTLDTNPVLWRDWHCRRTSLWARGVAAVYVALAVGLTGLCLFWIVRGYTPGIDFATYLNGLLVAIGLLILCVTSTTSLAEDRARGGLEVLLSTTLPTREIVRGTWWGAYRTFPLLAILPGLISAFLAYGKGRWIGVVLLVSLILAYGAALVSLGQYLSIRARRPGWALPLSTAIYVLAIVVPIPMALMLWGPAEYPGPGLASASPFWGTGFFSAVISDRAGRPSLHWPRMAAWSFAWVVVYSAAAALMYRSALASFDRCLGRLPEEGCGDHDPRSDLVVR